MSKAQRIHDDTVQQAKCIDRFYEKCSDQVVDKSLQSCVTVLEVARHLDPFTYISVVESIQSAHDNYTAARDSMMLTPYFINRRLTQDEREAKEEAQREAQQEALALIEG